MLKSARHWLLAEACVQCGSLCRHVPLVLRRLVMSYITAVRTSVTCLFLTVCPPQACEMITISGKSLAASKEKKVKDTLEGFMARLQRLAESKELPARIKFLIKDVVDMRKNKWVPRRETFTAKKLDEVHAEAEAELGMVSSRIVGECADVCMLS